jgi:lipopolysaccharide export system protein LptA
MRRSEAARYARWSATVALLLAMTTAGVYLKRKWSQHLVRKSAPPAAPVNVERQSNGLTFSKVEGERKIFTVTASKSTDFRDKDATLLESVHITIFGKDGDRNDVINTQSCQYSKTSGAIECSGDVKMDLQSAADAERSAHNPWQVSQVVHVETSGVTFDRDKGTARSSEPVKLTFPSGAGHAVGVEYTSEKGFVRLLRDVQFTFTPPLAPQKKSPKPGVANEVQIRGTSLDFDRDARTLFLHGPAEAHTEKAQLSSGEVLVELDRTFRAQVLHARPATNGGGRPELKLHARDGSSELTSDTLVAYISPQGWLTRAEASGSVAGTRQTPAEQEDVAAASASLELWPKTSQPKQIDLNGSVILKTQATKSAVSRTLQTNSVQLRFSPASEGTVSKPQIAQTLAPGTLEWTEPVVGSSGVQRTRLKADTLEMYFGFTGKPGQLLATGNMSTERVMPGREAQTASARKGSAQLRPDGGWSQIELQNDVALHEGDRSARAEHALFLRQEDTATLTGKASVRDSTSETTAPRIVFHQQTGDIFAEAGVRSTDLSAKGTLQLAPAPTNVTADRMQANSKTGRAQYSGRARLWQGDSILEADTIELLRSARTIIATDHVRAVFPQAATAQQQAPDSRVNKPSLWHITAGSMTYYDTESRAHAERDVVAQSTTQKTRAAAMDLYFTRDSTNSSPNGSTNAQRISRGVATGGVTVEEGGRKAVAERGDYTASEGKFVMSGGTPTIFDGSAGTTTGRQLTFFLASDTIIVDSENGSRILTKHRVER